jgi:hypothetical protein
MTPDATPTDHALWNFFTLIDAMLAREPAQATALVQQASGLSRDAAKSLADMITVALARQRGSGPATAGESRAALCAALRAARTDAEFAAVLVDLDAAADAALSRHAESILQSIDSASAVHLRQWVEANFRQRIHVVKPDYAALLAAKTITREQLLARACAEH